ncbi:BlaI/MecI/CopY family transcriptional regulator [Clostridioides difficile]
MEQQEVMDKLHRGELMLMEYMWRKSTTEILLKRLVKMKILNKKRVGFKTNYEVLVTKKGFLISQRIGKHVHYTVLVKEKEYLKLEGKRIFGGLHNNPLSELISKLHNKEEITEEKITEIGEWIKSWQDED